MTDANIVIFSAYALSTICLSVFLFFLYKLDATGWVSHTITTHMKAISRVVVTAFVVIFFGTFLFACTTIQNPTRMSKYVSNVYTSLCGHLTDY